MRSFGFLKSDKLDEKRVAILFDDLKKIKNKNNVYIEEGYYENFNIEDTKLRTIGFNVCSREEILKKDIICDPKIGDSSYLTSLNENSIIFGWIHAVQNKDITDKILYKNLTAIAWEDMYENGRHSFWRSNEIAGEAAILHAFNIYGKLPYETKVAVIGRGNIARGALKTLVSLGAKVTVFDRKMESLLREEISEYDVIVNAILWDTTRKDHIIYKKDLKNMKRESMIIDISCDRSGAIETTIPTKLRDPIYLVDGIIHYAVDHTPTILYKSASKAISKEVVKFVDILIENRKCDVLEKATCILDGNIMDQRINRFQKRNIEILV